MATVAMLPLMGALKVFIKKSPSSGVIGKLNDLVDEASRQLKINFKVNGEYVTPDGFRVKVEDQAGPVQKIGSNASGITNNLFPVDRNRYASELKYYPDERPFDAQKMINDGLITKTRYSVGELDMLLKDFVEKGVGKSVNGKQGEIIFVMKQDGEIVFSMRRADDYLPHPVLSNGEDVLSAGTITSLDDGTLEITRKSGHFKPELESLTEVREHLELNGYEVEINPSFL